MRALIAAVNPTVRFTPPTPASRSTTSLTGRSLLRRSPDLRPPQIRPHSPSPHPPPLLLHLRSAPHHQPPPPPTSFTDSRPLFFSTASPDLPPQPLSLSILTPADCPSSPSSSTSPPLPLTDPDLHMLMVFWIMDIVMTCRLRKLQSWHVVPFIMQHSVMELVVELLAFIMLSLKAGRNSLGTTLVNCVTSTTLSSWLLLNMKWLKPQHPKRKARFYKGALLALDHPENEKSFTRLLSVVVCAMNLHMLVSEKKV